MPGEPAFVPQMGMGLLLTLAVLKIVATGLTISSGGSGGVFGPSVFIGGMLGGAVGQLLRAIAPDGERSTRRRSRWSAWEGSSPGCRRRR